MRILEARGQAGRRYTIFPDSQAAIRRALNGSPVPGQQWARAIIEVVGWVMANNNHIWICWVPAHRGIQGNEMVDEMAKEAASGQSDEVLDRVRWQTSLPHLARRTTERRTAATKQWIRDHVDQSDDIAPQEAAASGGGLCRECRTPRPSAAISYCQVTRRSAPSYMTG